MAVAAEPQIALVLGGARSGKSTFAEQLATRLGEPVLFIATASAIDGEMAERIARHRAARPGSWRSVEAPMGVGPAIREHGAGASTVLIDCLTLLVSNCLVGPEHDRMSEDPDRDAIEAQLNDELAGLLSAAADLGLQLVVVSNEVGMGVVPAYPLGRVYRDLLGRANQRLAELAQVVYLLVAGIAIDIKRLDS